MKGKRILSIIILTMFTVSCFNSFVLADDENSYPEAEYVWDVLQEAGYNNYVCAGILGNMMVECGGLTLELQPTIDGGGYYGICQWSNKYYPEIKDTDLETQCNHLIDSLERTLNLFGAEDEYDKFIALTDEKEVALVFAKYYEVCASLSYEKRQNCASEALEYFAGPTSTGASNQREIIYFLN